MSLLSGVKFIPKDNREKSSSDHHVKKSKRSKSEKKKSKKSDRQYEWDEVDDWEGADEETFGEIDKNLTDPKPVTSKRSFSELLAASISDSFPEPDEKEPNETKIERTQRKREDRCDFSKPKSDEHAQTLSKSNEKLVSDSNSSVAAMLRQKLKSRTPLTSQSQSNSSNTSSYGSSDVVVQKVALEEVRKNEEKRSLHTSINDNSDLRDLIAFERLGGDDIDAMIANGIFKSGAKYKAPDDKSFTDRCGEDEDDEDADPFSFLNKQQQQRDSKNSKNKLKQLSNPNQQHLQSYQREERRLLGGNCRLCSQGGGQDDHLVVHRGQHVSVRLKESHLSLEDGLHVQLVPVAHVAAYTQCDEDTRGEMDQIKRRLERVYERAGHSGASGGSEGSRGSGSGSGGGRRAFFLEAAVGFAKGPHAVVEVVPLSGDVADDAIMFFRESIVACDEEWTAHKILTLSRDKPLVKCFPKNLRVEYVAVEWSARKPSTSSSTSSSTPSSTGYARALEATSHVASEFCLDVMSRLKHDGEPYRLLRARKPAPPRDEKIKVDAFKALWEAAR